MRLDDYAVNFPNFPWVAPLNPFNGWDPARPTASLHWYDAYNAVKHNREGEFERATLLAAFEAVTACAIMIVAQFGLSFDGWLSSDSGRFFNFSKFPKWLPTDAYTILREGKWTPKPDNWKAVKYPFKQT